MSIFTCPFCSIKQEKMIIVRQFGFVIEDKYPVNIGHLLIIPTRHVADYFELNEEEKNALWKLVDDAKQYLDEKYFPIGFNVGINVGESAGQTIPHVHIHLIPRYKGDMADPTGGVRGVIPEKQKY